MPCREMSVSQRISSVHVMRHGEDALVERVHTDGDEDDAVVEREHKRKMLSSRSQDNMKTRIKWIAAGCVCLLIITWFSVGTKREVKYEAPEKSDCRVFKGKTVVPNIPVIYAVTPTYARHVQKAELTRLSHTFMLVPNLHWIIVEDAANKSDLVSNLLRKSEIPHTHLVEPTPQEWKHEGKEPRWKKPRGVLQRNRALDFLRTLPQNDSPIGQAVIYFADDDNSYSLEIFEEMRHIKGVGVWPVGLVGGLMVEKPIVDPDTHKVVGFNSFWKPQRTFPIDMAGFAVNLGLLLKTPEAKFSLTVEGGYQEGELLRHLTVLEELEPLADYCTKVYVWHTRTEAPKLPGEMQLRKKGQRSDKDMEV